MWLFGLFFHFIGIGLPIVAKMRSKNFVIKKTLRLSYGDNTYKQHFMGLSCSILEYVWQILWLAYVTTIVPYFARLAAILVVLRIVEGRFVVKI